MPAPMTQHARARLQQRGIPQIVLDSLLDYGREEHDHRGSAVIYFDHRARKKLLQECGEPTYRLMESHLGAYAVIGSDGAIVTVGHRTRRINHH
jgi:hypothetical protein